MSESSATVPRPRLFYTEPEWVDVGDVRVAYRRKGVGEPTIFLHGAGGTRMWLPFYEQMAASVDLVAPEHPGFGETEGPEWRMGFDDLVLHYRDFADALGLDRFHLVGFSVGGWIAAECRGLLPGTGQEPHADHARRPLRARQAARRPLRHAAGAHR